MKHFNKRIVIVFAFSISLSFSLLVTGCQKRSEPAPFFEGLILEYGESGVDGRYIYEINSLDDNGFKITKKEKWKVLKF